MKIFMRILIVVLTTCFTQLSAQAQFEGRLKVKIEAIKLPAELESMKSMMESNMTIYTKGFLSRTEVTTDVIGTSITITDTLTGRVVTCTQDEGGKLAIESNYKSDLEESKQFTLTSFKKLKENKNIAGYKCHKGIYTITEEGITQQIEIWYSPEIANSLGEMMEVPGMIMEMLFDDGEVTIKYHVLEVVKEKVPASLFEIPEGYQLITLEDMDNIEIIEEEYAPMIDENTKE